MWAVKRCITYRAVSIGVTVDGGARVNLPGAPVAAAVTDESHSRHVHGSQLFFNFTNNGCIIFMTMTVANDGV